MPRPYAELRIDALESEYERARSQGDSKALKALLKELKQRKATPRVAMLLRSLQSYANSPSPTEPTTRTSGSRTQAPLQGGRRPTYRPTQEQEQAIEDFLKGGTLKINAYAGSGKTSTLSFLAFATPKRGQYLAFNRKIVDDSRDKFPSQVNTSTTHGVAYRSLVSSYPREQLNEKINANHLVELLELKPWRINEHYSLAARSQAYLILSTIRKFCQSDKANIEVEHVPRHGKLATAGQEVLDEVAVTTLRAAHHIWARMCAKDDPLPLGHDGYLKLWAMGRPRFQTDYILMDEAQDTNPVVLDVLKQQEAQLVYVGDKYQQIYEWRGAINAMDQVAARSDIHLTTSFRFGGEVATLANCALRLLGEQRQLVGNPQRASGLGPAPGGTILARTNATTISACIETLDAGKRPHLVGGTKELMNLLRGVQELKGDQPASSAPEFFGYTNWNEVLEAVRAGEAEELVTFVNLVEQRGEQQLLWALNKVVDEEKCDLIISTAHKSKGREWDSVRLMDDFLRSLPKKEHGQPTGEIDPAELRLLYVAVTRAKNVLEVPEPLLRFLHTGQLPPVQQTAQTQSSRQPQHRHIPQPRPIPVYTPPANWQERHTPLPTAPQPTRQASPRSATPVPPRPPVKPKKRGILDWLLGN